MNTKGVGLSFNVIIIAIISLLVLVIVVFILAKGTTNVDDGIECPQKGGRCVDSGTCQPTHNLGTGLCQDSLQDCCSLVPIR